MTRAKSTSDTVTLHVPFRIVKRGGRKQMLLPPGAAAERPRFDNTLVKALARAFRWKRMIESGEFGTIGDLAGREGMTPTYMARVLRLTLLAPELVEAILTGRQPESVTLPALMKPFPAAWEKQWADSEASVN